MHAVEYSCILDISVNALPHRDGNAARTGTVARKRAHNTWWQIWAGDRCRRSRRGCLVPRNGSVVSRRCISGTEPRTASAHLLGFRADRLRTETAPPFTGSTSITSSNSCSTSVSSSFQRLGALGPLANGFAVKDPFAIGYRRRTFRVRNTALLAKTEGQ